MNSNYVGPLNPLSGETQLEVVQQWFEKEARRRPQFKQRIQDVEHTARIEQRAHLEQEIRSVLAKTGFPVNADEVVADLFSTLHATLDGYQKMIWTVAGLDSGHWASDPQEARELFVADHFRQRNPDAIRLLVYDVPMTHYGHIEKPRQLAGTTLAAVKWLYEAQ